MRKEQFPVCGRILRCEKLQPSTVKAASCWGKKTTSRKSRDSQQQKMKDYISSDRLKYLGNES